MSWMNAHRWAESRETPEVWAPEMIRCPAILYVDTFLGPFANPVCGECPAVPRDGQSGRVRFDACVHAPYSEWSSGKAAGRVFLTGSTHLGTTIPASAACLYPEHSTQRAGLFDQ